MPTGWRRWLPQSLFGRLMGVLAGGLMLAQLLSAAINVAERDRLLTRSYGMQPAQRIADVVQLLDSLGSADRERVVAVFDVPPLLISLHDSATGADADAPTDNPGTAGRAALFAAQLRDALGDDRALRVVPRAGFPRGLAMGRGRDMGGRDMAGREPGRAEDHAAGRRHGRGPGAAVAMAVLRTEVQLRDGRWARFDTELPPAPDTLPWRLALTLAVLLLAMLLLSWMAVRWVVRPLRVLAQAAQRLGEDIAQPPLPETGPREVRQAALAFNTMQQRLAQFIDERTRMLTALSHDLKTPLTRMRLRTELLDDEEARPRFEADLAEMEAMVSQTLAFLRGLGGHEPRAPVDINALLASLQSDNEAMGRTLVIEGEASAPFVGVASLLRRALGNLIDNAVAYGGDAGPVTLRVQDSAEELQIQVLDTGPGIPEAELERVFEPFHRLEASRSRSTGGTGLGLGITRAVARLHGGEVLLQNRPRAATGGPGGLMASLQLPRRPAAPG